MAFDPAPEWDGDTTGLRDAQEALAQRVLLKDAFAKELRTVAGFAVSHEGGDKEVRAAAVLLDTGDLRVLETQHVRMPARIPPLPDLLSFRALPALLEVLSRLSQAPDLALVDGEGIAHPRRLGIASHFGVVADLPTIGVASEALFGESATVLHEMRGAFTTLRDRGERIGWLLRSKPGCSPLVVSPGHRVAMATAPEMTMRFVTADRVPEPTRLALQLVSSGDR